MHRFQSKSVIRRLRFAALLLCLRILLPLATLLLLVRSLLLYDPQMTMIAMGMAALTIFCMVLQSILASRARCPLCMTPVLAAKGCSKHRSARSLLGSHRLRVAVAVLCKGSFTCPYCNEASVMEVRDRHHMKYKSNSRG